MSSGIIILLLGMFLFMAFFSPLVSPPEYHLLLVSLFFVGLMVVLFVGVIMYDFIFDDTRKVIVCKKCGNNWVKTWDSVFPPFVKTFPLGGGLRMNELPDHCGICQSNLKDDNNIRVFKYLELWHLIGQPNKYIKKLKNKEMCLWVAVKI